MKRPTGGDGPEGREAIAKTFARLFAEMPQKRLEIFVESISATMDFDQEEHMKQQLGK